MARQYQIPGAGFINAPDEGGGGGGAEDSPGVTTLLARLTAARAGYLDNINNAALATTAAQTGDAYAAVGSLSIVSGGSGGGPISQTEFTVTSGNTSAPQFIESVPATIAVMPGSGATALVQVSTASQADINTHYNAGAWNGTAVDWFDWTPGSVTEDTYDSITSPVMALRVTATGGSVDAHLVQAEPSSSAGSVGGSGSLQIYVGATDVTKYLQFPASATGLTAADITLSYSRIETDNDVTIQDVTSSLNDLASLTAAHNDWGIAEVSATLHPGLYRLDIADAVFASGANDASIAASVTATETPASPLSFQITTPLTVESIGEQVAAKLFTFNSGETGGSAVSGSVVYEIGQLIAGGGTDILATTVPGAYAAGTLGYIIGTNLNTTISSRAEQSTALVNTTWTDARAALITTTHNLVDTMSDQVTNLPTTTDLTAAVANLATNTQVEDAIQAAIEVNHLDHLVAVGVDPAAMPGASNSIWRSLLENDSGQLRFNANALETAPTGSGSGGSGLDAAGVRAALGISSANLDDQLAALPTAIENADALLGRNVAGGSTGGRTVSQALYLTRNRFVISGTTLTVYGPDDSTPSWTAVVTTTGGAVSAIDPT
jgi:hypothetical protein